MQFLAPLFLTALVAVAIPIALHLIQREKREAIPFPSLMFLRRIPHRSTRRRRVRDLPLLLLRIAAFVLLAGAFARPLLERRPAAAARGLGAREVVLLLDRSYSMSAQGRWERARAAALREVEALRPGDRMSIIAFDAAAAALTMPTDDRERLRGLITDLRPGSGATRFDPALRLAGDLVNASRLPRREVVLVSDLQRSGTGDGIEARLPAGTTFRAIVPDVASGGDRGDLAVASVSFRRTPFGGQERVTPTARVVNPGDVPFAGARLTLELGGRATQTTTVSVGAHAARDVELQPFTLSGPLRGSVSVGPDALPADDAWRFSLSPRQAIPVLALDARPGASLFLARALAAGGEDPGFSVTVRTGALQSSDLRGRAVVVLNGAPAQGGTVGRLREFVAQGGGVIIAAGPEVASWGAMADLLPGDPGPSRERIASGGAALGTIEMTHPVFDIFRAPHSGDLSAPRFYRYRAWDVRPHPGDSTTTVLARFDDGAVALAERRIGRGRVLAWASTLDREWTDLPVQPVFVPLMQRLVSYASAFQAPPPARTVGEVVDARALTDAIDGGPLVVASPDGTRRAIDGGLRTLPLEQQGFYRLQARDGKDADIAVNVDVGEANLSAWSPAQFATMVAPRGAAPALRTGEPLTAAEREHRQSLWWWTLLGAGLVLAMESVLANRRRRALVAGRSMG